MLDAGLWCEFGGADCAGRPALFLDRDGVIIRDRHFVGRAEDLRMIEKAAESIACCNAMGIPIVVVTNQSGIGRGYYDWSGFRSVQAALAQALAAAGAHLDAVLACAYHEHGLAPLRHASHPWRKPNPGMILEAAARMNLDLPRSWIIGDKVRDLAAGAAAGLAGGTLLARDDRERRQASLLGSTRFVVAMAASLAEAVARLIENGPLRGERSCKERT